MLGVLGFWGLLERRQNPNNVIQNNQIDTTAQRMHSASNTYIKTRETFTAATHATQTQHARGAHKTCNPSINLKMLKFACTHSNTLAAAVQFERKAHLNDAVTMQSLTLMIKHVNTDVLQCINQNLAEQDRSVPQYTASTHAMPCACVVSKTQWCRINEERTNTAIAPVLQPLSQHELSCTPPGFQDSWNKMD